MKLDHLSLIIVLALGLASTNAFAAPSVAVANVETRPMERATTQPASVEPYFEAKLNAKITGYVDAVHVDIGDSVRSGQALFTIAAPEMASRLASLEGKLAASESDEKAAKAELAAVQSESRRIQQLVQNDSLSDKAGQEAKKRLETARAAVASAAAATTTARADLDEAQALMDYATVRAPFDGVVTSRSVNLGDLVYSATSSKGSAAPLMKVAQTDKLRLVTYLPENDALWLDVGDAAVLSFNAIPGKTFSGEVSRHSAALDAATRKLRVEVDIDNSAGALLPGLFGEAKIILETQKAAVVVPAGSVRFDGEPHVYVLQGDSSIRKTRVALGMDDGKWLQIKDGLSGGEKIVSGMVGRLADGDKVIAR